MKATGIVRRVDELGRVVIPKELRRTMSIDEFDSMEIFVDGNMICLKKYEPACTFCGNVKENMVSQAGKLICPDCIADLNKQAVLDKATSKRR